MAAAQLKRRIQRLVADDRLRGREPDKFAAPSAKIGGLFSAGCSRDLMKQLPRQGLDISLISKVPAGGQVNVCIKPHELLDARCKQHLQ